ncbi:MAG TPA: sigma-70 family RNA polymerase sigma factor [Solirubrobacteraceae bacterium]|nr:sigma-70 family RNA polymerase sigma factor [Solirubrobacteraceae bacterium]
MGGNGRARPAVAAPAQPGGQEIADPAKQELVRSHLPLVRAVARRYGGRGEDLEELVQVGSLALVKASSRFDPDRGVAFASFAAPAVEGEIRRHLSDRRRRGTPSIADAPDGAADPAGELTVGDESESRVLLADSLRVLEDRERRIVFLRFHADMTERQIASKIGLSQAHVSRLLEGALAKLRAEFDDSGAVPETGDTTEAQPISPAAGRKIDSVRARGQRTGATAKPEEGPVVSPERQAAPDPPQASDTTPARRRGGRGKAGPGYSGRILVRMPSELHEQLAQAAEREDLSLNRYVTETLSTSVDPGLGSPRRRLRLALATNVAVIVVAAVVAVVLLVLALQRGI